MSFFEYTREKRENYLLTKPFHLTKERPQLLNLIASIKSVGLFKKLNENVFQEDIVSHVAKLGLHHNRVYISFLNLTIPDRYAISKKHLDID